MRVYSFVVPAAKAPYNSFTADVKDFFNYLVKNESFPESQQYMLSKHLHIPTPGHLCKVALGDRC